MNDRDESILITGAKGFIGKNLAERLRCKGYSRLKLYDVDTETATLDEYVKECSYIFHLAGINRPQNNEEFTSGNHGSTVDLIERLKKAGRSVPILFSSSVQAELENDYGRSKLAAEKELLDYGVQVGAPALIFRLPNVYGKWCRPNYNSVVATFCHNVERGLPIAIHNPDTILNLVFIDDVCDRFIEAMEKGEPSGRYDMPIDSVALGRLASLIESFKDAPNRPPTVPDVGDRLVRNLYSAFLSYKLPGSMETSLLTHGDERGSFTEILHFSCGGQVSVNVSKPGVMKGNHWHHSKIEKFIAVAGTGEVRLRHIHGSDVLVYPIDGGKPSVVDIPGGYIHQIVNTGATDLIVIIWANDIYDPEDPDTFRMDL